MYALPGGATVVEYAWPKPAIRMDRVDDLSPIPLAGDPLGTPTTFA